MSTCTTGNYRLGCNTGCSSSKIKLSFILFSDMFSNWLKKIVYTMARRCGALTHAY